MRLTRTLALAAILTLGWAGLVSAQGTGRSLDIQPGGRENGMGAAGVALIQQGAEMSWWNPGAMAFLQKPTVGYSYAQLVPGLATDVNHSYLSYLTPVQGIGALGVGFSFLSYGTSEATDAAGNSDGSFTSYEFSPSVFWGTRLMPDLAFGVGLKWIRIQLAPSAYQGVGSTFGVDLGGLYRIPSARLNLGVNLQNLGPSVTFLNEDNKSALTRNVKVGAAWEAIHSGDFRATAVADFNQCLVTKDFKTYNGGGEIKYSQVAVGVPMSLAGRMGYYYDPTGDIKGLTYGFGVTLGSLALDIGSVPQAQDSGLPNVTKLTAGYRF